jgi:hypothetical protein
MNSLLLAKERREQRPLGHIVYFTAHPSDAFLEEIPVGSGADIDDVSREAVAQTF